MTVFLMLIRDIFSSYTSTVLLNEWFTMVDTYEETFFLLMLPQFCLMNELTMVDTYEVSYAFQRVQMQIYKSQPKGKDSKRKRHISISFYVHFAMHLC